MPLFGKKKLKIHEFEFLDQAHKSQLPGANKVLFPDGSKVSICDLPEYPEKKIPNPSYGMDQESIALLSRFITPFDRDSDLHFQLAFFHLYEEAQGIWGPLRGLKTATQYNISYQNFSYKSLFDIFAHSPWWSMYQWPFNEIRPDKTNKHQTTLVTYIGTAICPSGLARKFYCIITDLMKEYARQKESHVEELERATFALQKSQEKVAALEKELIDYTFRTSTVVIQFSS